jgi:hypothetical protein
MNAIEQNLKIADRYIVETFSWSVIPNGYDVYGAEMPNDTAALDDKGLAPLTLGNHTRFWYDLHYQDVNINYVL